MVATSDGAGTLAGASNTSTSAGATRPRRATWTSEFRTPSPCSADGESSANEDEGRRGGVESDYRAELSRDERLRGEVGCTSAVGSPSVV